MRKLILISCLATIGTAHAAESGTSEKILGYQPTKTGIIFQVTSGGCTHIEDFVTEVQKTDTGVTEVKLIRIKPDNCHPFLPMGIRFKLSYDQMGLTTQERYTVTNQNGVVHASAWE